MSNVTNLDEARERRIDKDDKEKYFQCDIILARCLIYADIGKKAHELILFIMVRNYMNRSKTKHPYLKYQDYIDISNRLQVSKDIWGNNIINNTTFNRVINELNDKNIIIENKNDKTLFINRDVTTWNLSPDKMEKINHVIIKPYPWDDNDGKYF